MSARSLALPFSLQRAVIHIVLLCLSVAIGLYAQRADYRQGDPSLAGAADAVEFHHRS